MATKQAPPATTCGPGDVTCHWTRTKAAAPHRPATMIRQSSPRARTQRRDRYSPVQRMAISVTRAAAAPGPSRTTVDRVSTSSDPSRTQDNPTATRSTTNRRERRRRFPVARSADRAVEPATGASRSGSGSSSSRAGSEETTVREAWRSSTSDPVGSGSGSMTTRSRGARALPEARLTKGNCCTFDATWSDTSFAPSPSDPRRPIAALVLSAVTESVRGAWIRRVGPPRGRAPSGPGPDRAGNAPSRWTDWADGRWMPPVFGHSAQWGITRVGIS